MNSHSRNPQSLVLFVAALVFLTFLASTTGIWSVASAQRGTVPPPPPSRLPPQTSPPPSSNQTDVPPIQLRPPATLPTPELVCFDALAFHSARDGNLEIYIMNGDGSGLSRLTNANPIDEHPAPSPEGRLMAFDSTRDPPNSHIFVMNVDGTNVRRLTSGNFSDRTPHWSPDNQRLAFESNRDGSFQIYTMNYDGSDIRQLTRGLGENTQAQFSKDNTRLAFVSTRDGHPEIYVMSATDGANQTRLTNTPGNKNSSHPTWSLDSRRIAFESDRTGNYEIFVMNANGTDSRQITKTDAPLKSNRFPYWVPSCDDRIAFSSNRDDPDFRIWVTNPDGSNQHRLRYERVGLLANPNAPDEHAAWSGAPVLPLANAPFVPTAASGAATLPSALLPNPTVTPQLANAPSIATPEPSATSASNPNAVSNSDPGFWGWLISLWARLTGK